MKSKAKPSRPNREKFVLGPAVPLPRGYLSDHGAGVHRSPRMLLEDAIQRSLGWAAEDELRGLVERYTGIKMSLGESDRFSQEVAQIVISGLIGTGQSRERPKTIYQVGTRTYVHVPPALERLQDASSLLEDVLALLAAAGSWHKEPRRIKPRRKDPRRA